MDRHHDLGSQQARRHGRLVAGKSEQLRTFPKLPSAARTMASAMEVLMDAPEATTDRLVPLVEVWKGNWRPQWRKSRRS
ncbi:hypothetical protein [Nonomuraea sp. NPDC003754]